MERENSGVVFIGSCSCVHLGSCSCSSLNFVFMFFNFVKINKLIF